MDDRLLLPHLAELSRLDIGSNEQQQFAEQVPKILSYVGQLGDVQTELVPSPRDQQAPLRTDEAQPSKTVDAILDQAPERQDRWWKVSGVFS